MSYVIIKYRSLTGCVFVFIRLFWDYLENELAILLNEVRRGLVASCLPISRCFPFEVRNIVRFRYRLLRDVSRANSMVLFRRSVKNETLPSSVINLDDFHNNIRK